MREGKKKKILILGGSGFIGNALYKELHPYYEVQGTYCKQSGSFENNHVFRKYCVEKDSMALLLQTHRPDVILSTLKGDYEKQFEAHEQVVQYALSNKECHVVLASSSDVFDGQNKIPSYEGDTPLSISELGRFKISVERLLLDKIPGQSAVLRLPIILGINSPTIFHLRQCIRHHATFEVFPNLVITATTIGKVSQQVHYIINQNLKGVFHLASSDMIHHDDLFAEIATKIGDNFPIFKKVYSSNEDSFDALLPKKNLLPKPYRITISEVIEESSLNEEIVSIR